MTIPFLDLSQTAAPKIVAELSFTQELDDFWSEFLATGVVYNSLTDHDPGRLLAHAVAYRIMTARQHVNESAKAALLAFAQGTDLDALVAGRNMARLLVDPGDPEAVPPKPPVWETDAELRRRALLKLESISSAGPRATYLFHALTADPTIRDAFAYSPTPGDARVVLLGRDGDGTVGTPSIATVFAALNVDDVRPITDRLSVVGAIIVEYEIRVHLTIRPGVDPQILADQIREKLLLFAEEGRKIGEDVRLSKISAVCHTYLDANGNAIVGSNVEQVNIQQPGADVEINRDSASFCTSVTVTHEVGIDG